MAQQLSEGEERALRSDLGLNSMAGQQANTIMQQIADGDVDPDDLKKTDEEAQKAEDEGQKTAEEEATQARQEAAEKQTGGTADQSGTTSSGNTDLESQTVEQLQQQAKDKGLTGYSSMNKQELITALRSAG